jgi:metal-sulfur cluster biosynthetic enzyme
MGLIDAIHVAGSNVRIDMILTSGWCPFAMHLLTDMEHAVIELAGVEHVDVNIVWGPTWTPERLSPDARKKLSLPMEKLLPLREARLRNEQETSTEIRTAAP